MRLLWIDFTRHPAVRGGFAFVQTRGLHAANRRRENTVSQALNSGLLAVIIRVPPFADLWLELVIGDEVVVFGEVESSCDKSWSPAIGR